MLREIKNVRQDAGKTPRRWFTSEKIDLVVWLDERGEPAAFQLCYNKGREEKALTWQDDGFSHRWIDDGEGSALQPKASPMLGGQAPLQKADLDDLVAEITEDLPPSIRLFVLGKLEFIKTRFGP